jgi:hypothetical protein
LKERKEDYGIDSYVIEKYGSKTVYIYTIWFLNANGKILFNVLNKRVTGKKAKYRTAFTFMLNTACALFYDTYVFVDIYSLFSYKGIFSFARVCFHSCLSRIILCRQLLVIFVNSIRMSKKSWSLQKPNTN